MKFLLDTNVYIEAASSSKAWQKFEDVFIPILPFISLSSVVAFELAILGNNKTENLLNSHVRAMKKVNRIVTPSFQDWISSSSYLKGKKMRSQLCDVLIAQCARQLGAVLFTFDFKDFKSLSKQLRFQIQKPW